MHFNKILVGSLAIAGIALSACTTDQIEIPKSELYAREFIKQFGVVDPNHDWNNATQGTVTVVTTSPTHVEVLADIKGKRYIFADYKNVKGSENISFTIPKGVNDIIVTLNGREYKTTLGATVKPSLKSRAIWEKEDEVVKITRGDYREIRDETVLSYRTTLPEGSDNRNKVTQNFTFTANGDFTIYPIYWNTGGWNTLGIYYIDEEKNEMVYVPFYTNKILPVDGTKGNILYTYNPNPKAEDYVSAKENIPLKDANRPMDAGLPFNGTLNPSDFNNRGLTSFQEFEKEDWDTFKRRYILKLLKIHQYYFKGSPFDEYFDIDYLTKNPNFTNDRKIFVSGIDCEAKDENHVNITKLSMGPLNDWIYPGELNESSPSGERPTAWKARGINISMKPGTKFGMYIRAWWPNDSETLKPSIDNVDIVRVPINKETGMPESDGYRRYYSDSKYNNCVPYDGAIISNHAHAATYMYEAPSGTYRVLGFEDAIDNDLNDMIFFITSLDPEDIPDVKDEDKPEPEKYEYLIAAEDLGGTCDWDFNDMVASINVVAKNYVESTDGSESTNSYPYNEVTVTPLASGGTLPIYLMYTGKVSTGINDYQSTPADYMVGEEFHSWLSGNPDTSTPINVGANASSTGKSITFHVPDAKYTLGLHEKYSASEGTNNMGGFWVLVVNKQESRFDPAISNGDLHPQPTIPTGKGITKIVAPHSDRNVGNLAPQMICIGHEWFWPREGKKIHDAYPTTLGKGFEGWLKDHTSVKGDWYGENKYIESLVTKRNL